ncbi:hypothetical protein N0V90_010968 [Kalmusia sp. IMI 367209]|nr:hypothetical protein N0V90_010968 [Kalmusia sp. IMI 367209]
MSWTGQWFRKETWQKVKNKGHLAHPLPKDRLKITLSDKLQRWVVRTDDEDTRECIERERDFFAMNYMTQKLAGEEPNSLTENVARAFWMPMNEMPMFPPPQRHFMDRLVNYQPYLHYRNIFLRDALIILRDHKSRFKAPMGRSVAAKPLRYRCRNPASTQLSKTKRMSVAAGSMVSSSSSESSSDEYIGSKPGVLADYIPTFRELSPLSPPASSSHKRSRSQDYLEEARPIKKARRAHEAQGKKSILSNSSLHLA